MKDRKLESLGDDPEKRTTEFFAQGLDDLADSLKGMTIAVPGTKKRLEIGTDSLAIETYQSSTNRRHPYNVVLTQEPGMLTAVFWSFRHSTLPLIAVSENGEKGACVRITQAQITDTTTGLKKEAKNGKEMMDYLGFESDDSARLAFLDPSNILWVVKDMRETLPTAHVTPESTDVMAQLLHKKLGK